jgi:DNA gyrase/topoisomerase IV subunit B/DNA gyrase/topoisomerase IV subunit A
MPGKQTKQANKNVAQRYEKKDPIEHCLLRSDMYVGSTRLRTVNEYVAKKEDDKYHIMQESIKMSPAILRIFIEALSNAIDNVERSRKTRTPCTEIRVTINQETGETSVWNDGDIVPIELHPKEGCYIHTMIFGQLLTGSNYNDEEERIVSGRNGLGIKLTGIFSSQFTVEGCDPKKCKKLRQTWTNNLRSVSNPIVTNTSEKRGYTKVTWTPDFFRFELDGYTTDIVKLYTRYVIDSAMLSKVKVFLNDELVPVNNLREYASLYKSPTDECLYIKTKESEVLLTPSMQYQAISFVNGIYTRNGGRHVDAWAEGLFRPIVDKFNGKDKKTKTKTPKININDVKQFFRLFVVSTVVRPEFDSQEKNTLESPEVEAQIKRTHIATISKWSVIEQIESIIRAKEMVVLKKAEKTTKKTKIEGYDRANKAGTKDSSQCTLFITEGLSAKTYVVAGIRKGIYGRAGRDYNGVLPVKGKCVAPNTDILLWNGTIKKAKDVVIGDELIGDDGNPRQVVDTCTGIDKMYEIQQNRGDNYTVNSLHTLCFKINGHCMITDKEDRGMYTITWFDKEKLVFRTKSAKYLAEKFNANNKSCKSCKSCKSYKSYKSYKTKEQALSELEKFRSTLDTDNTVNIDIQDYMSLDPKIKRNLKGYKLSVPVNWKHKDVQLDPYILGMWLGDGNAQGWGFASADSELVNVWTKWARECDGDVVHGDTKYTYYIRSGKKEKGEHYHPLRYRLNMYNLIGNKHVPLDYIVNSTEVRMKLLAGFIDTNGHVRDGSRIEIAQSYEHKQIIVSMIYIARSLGFTAYQHTEKTTWTCNGVNKEGFAISMTICGNISSIPTILKRNVCVDSKHEENGNTGINILPKDEGEYVGLTLDGNHRFLLGDFTATHNCLNVRDKPATTIAANKVICSLIQALGLRHDVDYRDDNNFKKLNYGTVAIVADADCFTKDTPVLIRKHNLVDVITMESLYQQNLSDYELWSKSGWTKILAMKSKPTTKKILQITTGCGLIRCTEDHKFILEDGAEIKASELKVGNRLLRTRRIHKPKYDKDMTSDELRKITTKYQCYNQSSTRTHSDSLKLLEYESNFCNPIDTQLNITNGVPDKDEAFVWGLFFAEGSCDIYTFEKDRAKATQTNTEKSRKRWQKWVDIYDERIKKLQQKKANDSLDQKDTRLLLDSITRLAKERENTNRISTTKTNTLTRTNYSWAISNCDRDLLERSQYILQNKYPDYNWTIIQCTRDEQYKPLYKLNLNGGSKVAEFIKSMRARFYDNINRTHKKVPIEILNATTDIQQSFIDGYYAGDGFRYLRDTQHSLGFDILGQIGAQGLCFILERLGYCVNVHHKKRDIYTIHYSNRFRRLHPGEIKSIKQIPYNDVVYDVETENHMLNAGIGGIVVHNCDGLHIKGLLLNFIHSLYPTLLQREKPFVVSLETPIVRVFNKIGKDTLFYDEERFKKWSRECKTKINAKYYKGLGTTKPEDVPDTFGEKMVEFVLDDATFTNMQKAFHSKYADARKLWLEEYIPGTSSFSLDDTGSFTQLGLSDFINSELIKFSHADCARSIPSGIDGLKNSQRKILYCVKKRKLKYSGKSLKVAQLAGYTAEHSNYHHGEKNLYDTIVGIAQEFVGSNNIPLLYRDGQFGSRLEGGQDAADGRYIFTKMDALTELIFREEDEPLLTQVNDDGDLVEPEYYVPIIPMILINGCLGIGTGWSTKVPCYNPKDMIEGIRTWLEYDGEVLVHDPDDPTCKVSMFPEFTPWYRGFKGEIERNGETKFITYGIVEETKRNTVMVKELPIGMWTGKFSDFCEDLKADKKVKSVSNYSSPKEVSFVIEENDTMECNLDTLKLHSYLYTSNMVMFNEKNQLRKYDTIDEILDEFCRVRFDFYVKRKQHQIRTLEIELKYLENKMRFVQEVIDRTIELMNIPEAKVIEQLKSSGYEQNPKTDGEEGGYEYLLRMQVRTFTKEKLKQLNNDILAVKTKLETVKNTTEKEIWLRELNEFEQQYDIWLKEIENEVVKGKATRTRKTRR